MRRILLGVLLLLTGCATSVDRRAVLELAAFSSDATPPLGHPLYGGGLKVNAAVDEPLLLKGIVLSDGSSRYVLAVLDWCRLQTGAHDFFRGKLAAAAQTSASNVAVQCTHAHDGLIADSRAQEILSGTPSPPAYLDLGFMEEVTDRAARALRDALGRRQRFTHVGTGKGRVEQFASTRRPVLEDGKTHTRFSQTKDPLQHDAPEGKIDPWLRTVTFFDGERPLARLHYYASHLQNNHGDGRADPDVVGPLRERLEKEEGIPHLYFTGCAGDVTVGKYNIGPPAEMKPRLVERLFGGVRQAIRDTRRAAVTSLSWKVEEVAFAPRPEPEFSEERFRREMSDPSELPVQRMWGALALAWYERLRTRPGVEVSALQVGPVHLLHLPGEAFVEYQLYAQSLRPDAFVAVAAYGEGGPGYVCTDAALGQGGYEPTVSLAGPPSEVRLKAAIARLLGVELRALPVAEPPARREEVTAVAFSPDGKVLARGSLGGSIQVGDRVLEGHRGPVWSLSFSPDGGTLVSGGQDRTVRLWDVAAGRERLKLHGQRGEVWCVAFSRDGRAVASGSQDRGLLVRDAATGRELFKLESRRHGVSGSSFTALAFSPDGKLLASATDENSIVLWDFAARQERRKWTAAHRSEIWSVGFSPDGLTLASAGYDGAIRLWDVVGDGPARTIEGHAGWVTGVCFSPDGRRLASSGRDRTVRLWDAATGREERRLDGHQGLVYSVSFSPDGSRLASGSYDRRVTVWELSTR